MKRIALSLMLLGAGNLAAAAPNTMLQELKEAQSALAASDYPRAYDLYNKKAGQNGFAQFMLGMFHQQGWGRARNGEAACAWFAKAAQRGIPAAAHFWGDCLAQGIGRPPDLPAALVWYGKAADGGHLISLCTAGEYHIRGQGVPKDAARGLAMCTQVAQANSAPAMLKLAHTYRAGRDVPQDLAAARRWFQSAAELGAAEAQFHLGVMLSQGDGGESDLDKALFWLETAASAGHAPAYLPTAVLYGNAPVQHDTGVLAPEHLAKIYLWASAAKAGAEQPEERKHAAVIESQVLSVMPASWRPELDQQVSAHLAKHRQ